MGLFVAPGQLHLAIPTHQGDCSFYLLIIGEKLFDTEVTSQIHSAAPHGVLFRKGGEHWEDTAVEAVENAFTYYRGERPTIERLRSYIMSFTESPRESLSHTGPKGQTASPALNAMLCYIHDNYQKRLSLTEIAEIGHVSRTTCYNLFHTNLGRSPSAYINYYRLTRSLERLKNTGQPLSEIALNCGFNSHSYYAEAFRKQFGITPREYRRNHTNM